MIKVRCSSVIRAQTTLQFFIIIFPQYRYAKDSSMFSLAPILPRSDVQIGRTLVN